MPNHHCCVVDCQSDSRVAYKHGETIKWFKFPSKNTKLDLHLQWTSNLNRKDYVPTDNSRVCHKHFIDYGPSKMHPVPCLNMGYAAAVYTARIQPIRQDVEPPRKIQCVAVTPG